jgi:hypothetical protein
MSGESNVDHLIVVKMGDFPPMDPVAGPWLKGRRTLNDAFDLAKSRTEPLAKRWHPTIMVPALPSRIQIVALGRSDLLSLEVAGW